MSDGSQRKFKVPMSRKVAIRKRRREIAQHYLQGQHDTRQIAEALNVSTATVRSDLKVLARQWEAQSEKSFSEYPARVLAEAARIKDEYWREYHRSKEPKRTVTSKQARDATGRVIGEQEVTTKIEERLGDPRYLKGVEDCLGLEVKILGLATDDIDMTAGSAIQRSLETLFGEMVKIAESKDDPMVIDGSFVERRIAEEAEKQGVKLPSIEDQREAIAEKKAKAEAGGEGDSGDPDDENMVDGNVISDEVSGGDSEADNDGLGPEIDSLGVD
jgi:DNA-binding CsgD family transcriptional regulator